LSMDARVNVIEEILPGEQPCRGRAFGKREGNLQRTYEPFSPSA